MSGIRSGTNLEPKAFAPITREQLKDYSVASGDFNRIHLDDEVARSRGLPGVIAHGMLSAANIAERAMIFVEEEFGLAGWKLTRFQTRFRAMVFPGDVISVGGTLKEVSDDVLVLELQARNQKGEVVTTGNARFAIIPQF